MNIDKYKKYVRDVEISDEDLEDIIKDVINDIARDTKIFSYQFNFVIKDCTDYYDIKRLLELSTNDDEKVRKVDYSNDDTSNYTMSIINTVSTQTPQSNDDGTAKTTDSTEDTTKLKYLYTKDIIWFKDNDIKYEPRSVLIDFFDKVDDDSFLLKHNHVANILGTNKYEIDVIADVIVVPNINDISEEHENIIKTCLINGIKYFTSDMYMNIQNEQVSNLLYQRFYSCKKQLLYNFPQNVSNYRNFKNKEWNK